MVPYEGSAISHAYFTESHYIAGDEIPPKIVACDAHMVKTLVITTLVLARVECCGLVSVVEGRGFDP